MEKFITIGKHKINVSGIFRVFREIKTDASKYSSECIAEMFIKEGLNGKDALKLLNIYRQTRRLPPVTLVRYASEITTGKNGTAVRDLPRIVGEATPYRGSQLKKVWEAMQSLL